MTTTRRPGLRPLLALAGVAALPAVASAQITVQPRPAQALFPQPVQAQPAQIIQQPGTVITTTEAPIGTTVVGPVTTTTMPATPTIGGHQIDKFEAIRQVQADLKSDANNVINWTILGELAHEVALDLPEGQDDAYYKMSREAYEHAAALEPTNNGLKAALQFARDQEANAASFDARRRQGVSTYLDARRREMAATGVNPTVMVYETPTSTVTTTAAPVATATTTYPTASYRPYYNNQVGQPYSYNQYSTGYTPATGVGTATNGTLAAPTTLRQYGQQLPGVIINQGVRTIGR